MTSATSHALTSPSARTVPGGVRGYAFWAAAGWAVLSPPLTLAYLATPEGREYLAQASVRAWAEPAADLLGPLLESPATTYTVLTAVLAVLFPAVPLATLSMRRFDTQAGRAGRAAWWGALVGAAGFALTLAAASMLLIVLAPDSPAVELAHGGMLLFLLVLLLGSTALGVHLVRRGRRAAWWLALAVPGFVVGSIVLGHNSIGLVPVVIGWAVLTRRPRPAAPVASRM